MAAVLPQELFDPELCTGYLYARHLERINEQNDLYLRIGPSGIPIEGVKGKGVLRMTFIQQLEISATQTRYRISISVRDRYIEVNEPFSLVEHGNGCLGGREKLREERRSRKPWANGKNQRRTKRQTKPAQ